MELEAKVSLEPKPPDRGVTSSNSFNFDLPSGRWSKKILIVSLAPNQENIRDFSPF